MMQRWNPARKAYEPYHVPDSWKVSAYEDDMDKVISCARCGRDVTYGDCYTSRQIHTEHGFGYMVCDECYEKEWREEKDQT